MTKMSNLALIGVGTLAILAAIACNGKSAEEEGRDIRIAVDNQLCAEKVADLHRSLRTVDATDFTVIPIIVFPAEYDRYDLQRDAFDEAFEDISAAHLHCEELPEHDFLPPPDVITADCRDVIEDLDNVPSFELTLQEVSDSAQLLKRPLGLIDQFFKACQVETVED